MSRKLNLHSRDKRSNNVLSFIKIIFYMVIMYSISYWAYYVLANKKRIAESQRKNCLKYKNEAFTGIIDSIYDKFKVRIFQLKSDPRELSLWYYGNSYIEIGDSIIKKEGKLKYDIYKVHNPDSVLVLKFSCD